MPTSGTRALSSTWPPSTHNLPLLGQLYGGKGELNLETLLGSGAQVVIDVGEPKDTIVEDLDALQEQTGIPFVHVSATIETMGDAYRKLGELLGMEEEAETLATYCDETYAMVKDVAEHVEKANLLYITGDAGLNVIAQGSYHAEIIDLLSNNLAVVDSPLLQGYRKRGGHGTAHAVESRRNPLRSRQRLCLRGG